MDSPTLLDKLEIPELKCICQPLNPVASAKTDDDQYCAARALGKTVLSIVGERAPPPHVEKSFNGIGVPFEQ
jgi:hypothetical protein